MADKEQAVKSAAMYASGYRTGWLAATQAVVDLVLANGYNIITAQDEMMDFWQEKLLEWQSGEPPLLPRKELPVVDNE